MSCEGLTSSKLEVCTVVEQVASVVVCRILTTEEACLSVVVRTEFYDILSVGQADDDVVRIILLDSHEVLRISIHQEQEILSTRCTRCECVSLLLIGQSNIIDVLAIVGSLIDVVLVCVEVE